MTQISAAASDGHAPITGGGRTARHHRVVGRHRLRVVRLLPLRDARAVLRGPVLPEGERHGRAPLGVRDLRRRLPRPAVRRASSSGGSATSSAASTPSSSRSSSWARRRPRSASCRPTRRSAWRRRSSSSRSGCLQGLALGGEYGGAATYVAEHAPDGKRGYSHELDPDDRDRRLLPRPPRHRRPAAATMDAEVFRTVGLAHSRSSSRSILLGVSVYIRLKLRSRPSSRG